MKSIFILKKLLIFVCCVLYGGSCISQGIQERGIDRGYFRYPLDVPPKLNANFGEMRPSHFHMGLDMNTLSMENMPVYAVADGYVSRIKIEAGGFGNALYVDHPNGTTSLYAHLNAYFPALQANIKAQQYKAESWAIQLYFPAAAFPVKKGQLIGYSGNTGSSEGPHVHFEIRSAATEKCLNPLLYSFPLADRVAPRIQRVAVYDRSKSIYEQKPLMVEVTRNKSGELVAAIPPLKFEKVLLAIQATDEMSNFPNANGIYRTELLYNGKAIGGFRLDSLGYDQTRYLNAHIDFRTKFNGGPYLQFLMPLTGDSLPIYPYSKPGSYISLSDTISQKFLLKVADIEGNTTPITLTLRRAGPVTSSQSSTALISSMYSTKQNDWQREDIAVSIPRGMLYDSIHFRYGKSPANHPKTYSDIHQIHEPSVPMHGNMRVEIKPVRDIPYSYRDKLLIKRTSNGKQTIKKATWILGKYRAEFREFGNFQLIVDDEPPVVSAIQSIIQKKSTIGIRIQASDDQQIIKNFRGEVNGKWVSFSQKGSTFQYFFDENCLPGEHILTVSVEDEVGNKTVRQFTFKR